MGTTLTGTTPQDTYDSLIKVTDNAPLTGSLKVLTDGLGNDSALALSTGAASVTGTLAVTAGTNLATASGSVGIGTAAPAAKLDIVGTSGNTQLNVTSGSGTFPFITLDQTGVVKYAIQNVATTGLFTITEAGEGDRLVIAKTSGNVGIGTGEITTSTYAGKLAVFTAGGGNIAVGGATNTNNAIVSRIVSGNTNNGNAGNESSAEFRGVTSIESAIVTTDSNAGGDSGGYIMFKTKPEAGVLTEVGRWLPTGGLTFNGDTAAANALDDYEEGTWTMGVSFGGASVGVTTTVNSGTYTKIGRQVTVNGYLQLSDKGSSTGAAIITGLPFTIPGLGSHYAAASFEFSAISFVNQFQGVGNVNTTTILLEEVTSLGAVSAITNADFANNSYIVLSFTYFV